MVKEEFVSVAETARRLSVKPKTVRSWLLSGRLRGMKLGNAPTGPGRYVWRVPESAIAEFVAALPTNKEAKKSA